MKISEFILLTISTIVLAYLGHFFLNTQGTYVDFLGMTCALMTGFLYNIILADCGFKFKG